MSTGSIKQSYKIIVKRKFTQNNYIHELTHARVKHHKFSTPTSTQANVSIPSTTLMSLILYIMTKKIQKNAADMHLMPGRGEYSRIRLIYVAEAAGGLLCTRNAVVSCLSSHRRDKHQTSIPAIVVPYSSTQELEKQKYNPFPPHRYPPELPRGIQNGRKIGSGVLETQPPLVFLITRYSCCT